MDERDRRIDLWLMRTDAIDPATHQKLLARLNAQERDAHDRHAKPSDRLLHAAAHALKRHALSARFDGHPSAWTFTENPNGKPRLSNPPDGNDPRFNLSHTAGLVAVAVSHGIELGLDVEALDPAHADLDTAEAFAHPAEWRALDPKAADFIPAFYRLWTRKEALAKATGLGLALEVRQLILEDEIDGQWHLTEFDPTPQHRLALMSALGQGSPQIEIHEIEPLLIS
jgi:4'-phosphopantetheinyl transferase